MHCSREQKSGDHFTRTNAALPHMAAALKFKQFGSSQMRCPHQRGERGSWKTGYTGTTKMRLEKCSLAALYTFAFNYLGSIHDTQCRRHVFKTVESRTLEIKPVTIKPQVTCCLVVHFVHYMLTTVLL